MSLASLTALKESTVLRAELNINIWKYSQSYEFTSKMTLFLMLLNLLFASTIFIRKKSLTSMIHDSSSDVST